MVKQKVARFRVGDGSVRLQSRTRRPAQVAQARRRIEWLVD